MSDDDFSFTDSQNFPVYEHAIFIGNTDWLAYTVGKYKYIMFL